MIKKMKKILFILIFGLILTSQLFAIIIRGVAIEKPIDIMGEKNIHHYHAISTTLYVGGTGPNNFSTIQQAIDNATDGDTVFVYHDSSPYLEYLMITKEIDLIGENKLNTIINGARSEAVITIDAQYVTISEFTIQKNSTDKRITYGISLDKGYSIIHDTIISDMDYGIFGGGYQCQIINNQFLNCGLYPGLSYFRTIENNTVNNKPLVYLHGENSKIIDNAGQVIIEDCHNIIIQNLSISEVNFGIYLYESSLCKIRNNELTNSSIIIEKSNECVIRNNQISIEKKKNSEMNKRCISLFRSDINSLYGNSLTSKYGAGLYVYASNANVITRNLFIKNFEGVFVDGSYGIRITGNNFEQNCIHGHFLDCCMIKWKGNYWNRMRLLPKIIIGRKTLVPAGFMNPAVYIPWFNCDLSPSKLPNIIS